MKFTVKKNDIIDVLSNVQGLTGRKSNLAITGNILLSASKDGIVIAATDLETGFEGSYPASVESEGKIAINARKFFEIIREFPSDDILVSEIENRWIQIGNDTIEYHIVGMDHWRPFLRFFRDRGLQHGSGQRVRYFYGSIRSQRRSGWRSRQAG